MSDSTMPGASPEPLFENAGMRMKSCRHGVMLYNTKDVYIGRAFDLYGEYAESEMALLKHFIRPDAWIFDIGANIGAHTIFFAKALAPGACVVAFEPQRGVFQNLCANVALNGLRNVMTFHAGVGTEPGIAHIPVPDYAQDGNFGGIALTQGSGEPVQVMSVDQLGTPSVGLMKIDVEGMELDVLKGAGQAIAKFRPVLYVENDRREKSAALLAHIFGLGYRIYWHMAPLFNPANIYAHADNVFGNTISLNVLCVPGETPQNITALPEAKTPDEWIAG